MRAAGHLIAWAALGTLLFGIERALARPAPIAVDADRAAAAARAAGLEPDARVLGAFAREEQDEALLAREARRLGIDRGDAVVHETLARRADFFLESGGDAQDRAVDALRREIDARDPVVRRRLATRLAARIRAEAAAVGPDEDALRAWFDASRERWIEPPSIRLRHVYFAGADATARAHRARAAIERDALGPEAAARLGDPSLLGTEIPPADATRLAARLGAAFAEAAFAAPVGVWIGPIASSHGSHLLFVHERRAPRVPAFAEVASAVELAWRAERADAALAAELARLRGESRTR